MDKRHLARKRSKKLICVLSVNEMTDDKDKDEKKEQEFPDEWTEHIEEMIEEFFERNPKKQKH